MFDVFSSILLGDLTSDLQLRTLLRCAYGGAKTHYAKHYPFVWFADNAEEAMMEMGKLDIQTLEQASR